MRTNSKTTKTGFTTAGKLRKLLVLAMACLMLLSVTMNARPVHAAGNGVYTKLVGLKAKFPDGKFWNHQVTANSNNGDQLMAQRNEAYANSVTSYPCRTHNGTAAIGQYDCNYFDGGMQCMGFAKKVFYDVFGQRESSLAQRHDTQNLMVGDYVRINNNSHSGVVLSISGNTFRLVECNFDRDGAHHNCWIKWGYVTYNKSCITYFKHASNYSSIDNKAVNVQMSWQNARVSVSNRDATIYVTARANTSGRFTAASGTLYDANGKYLARKTETVGISGSYMNVWYGIRSELGRKLEPGTTYHMQFTATFGGKTYTSPYYRFKTSGTKTVAVSKITVSKGTLRLRKGKTASLKATVSPANATNRKVTWKSSNTKVATVTSAGKIKAVRRGTCTITATSANGKKATCRITVW